MQHVLQLNSNIYFPFIQPPAYAPAEQHIENSKQE